MSAHRAYAAPVAQAHGAFRHWPAPTANGEALAAATPGDRTWLAWPLGGDQDFHQTSAAYEAIKAAEYVELDGTRLTSAQLFTLRSIKDFDPGYAGNPRACGGNRGLRRNSSVRESPRDRRLNLKVGRAWAIKEALRALWTYRQHAAVKRFFTRGYGWAIRSRLAPVQQVAKTLKRHLAGVLRFVQHPITNGVAEGLNSKIMSIKRKAGGFRNPSHFTTAIYFHCGGLNLYPR